MPKKIMADVKALIEKSKEQGDLVKAELEKLIPAPVKEEEEEDIPALEELSNSLSKVKISQITKLRKFSKGENFSRFCERFREYISITKISDQNLYMLFLQNVDDERYSVLKTVKMTTLQKENPELFCDVYINVIYGDESISLKNDLMDCKQKSDEDVAEFAYRLREKANIAYSDPDLGEENCLLTFIRGVKDVYIKRRLNECTFVDFSEAVKQAKKLERVESMLNVKPEINSILKESSIAVRPSRKKLRKTHVFRITETEGGVT